MTPWIHGIATAVPGFSFSQEEAGRKMEEWVADERARRIVRALYRKSGIERRHSVVRDFDGGGPGSFFRREPGGALSEPGTAARNAIFARASRELSDEAARRVLAACPWFSPRDVTHVVTVSCTGFHNPGVDYHLVRDLGLRETVERYHLGFMGCYAAFPALRMAARFCAADPGAVVLVVCVELCTLHLRLLPTEDVLLANSLFADGAGAAVVSGRTPPEGRAAYRVGPFRCALVPAGEADMAWRIGDTGFDIALSSYVPKILGANIADLVLPALAARGLATADVDAWAVHPGGKSIVDQVEGALGLPPERVRHSREVLRRFGNMSSATILFVLQAILGEARGAPPETVCAMAFGPGLAVEMALLEAVRLPAAAPA